MTKIITILLSLVLFNGLVFGKSTGLLGGLNYFKNSGTVENTFNMITCNQKTRGEETNIETIWPSVCEVVRKSEFCKDLEEEDKLQCSVKNYHENQINIASFDFVWNCLWGAGEAIVDMFKFIGELVTSTIKMTYDKEHRDNKTGQLEELKESIMGYISLEYAKELDETGSKYKASAAVIGNVTSMLFKGIAQSLKKEFFQLGCYNQKARQAKLCEGITAKLIPIYGGLKIISKGFSSIKQRLTSERKRNIGEREFRGTTGRTYNETSSLPEFYWGEEKGKVFGTNVEYLSKKDRAPYEVLVGKDGKLVDVMGDPIDTSNAKIIGGKAVGIYVMAPNGKIYLSKSQAVGKFHHSSFLAGDDVAVAGELIIKDGVLKGINRHSGHYRPEKAQLRQIMQELKGRGADLKDVRVDTTVPDEKRK